MGQSCGFGLYPHTHGLAGPCAGLLEDDAFFGREVACHLTTNNYQKNETENYLQNYLQNYTTNYIQDCMDTQNTFPANNAEENDMNNIVNDIGMSDVFDEGGVGTGLAPFDDFGSADAFDLGGMGIDPTLSNGIDLADDFDNGEMGTGSVPLGNEAVADGTEDSSDTIYDPSSEVDKNG